MQASSGRAARPRQDGAALESGLSSTPDIPSAPPGTPAGSSSTGLFSPSRILIDTSDGQAMMVYKVNSCDLVIIRTAEKCINDKISQILLYICTPGVQTKCNQLIYYVPGNIVQNRKARDCLLQKLHFLVCCTKIFVMLSTNFMVLVSRY